VFEAFRCIAKDARHEYQDNYFVLFEVRSRKNVSAVMEWIKLMYGMVWALLLLNRLLIVLTVSIKYRIGH